MTDINPYASPESTDFAGQDATYSPKLFALSGRVGRLRYIAYNFLYYLVFAIVVGVPAALLIPAFKDAEPNMALTLVGSLLVIVLYAAMVVLMVALARRRLNDLGNSGWWQLLMFVPFVNILLALYMLFWPGNKGTNQFGPMPEKNSVGLIFAGLLLPAIALVGVLASVALPAYQDYVERARAAEAQSFE